MNGNLLDMLTREGVLITVSVRFWRAAKKLQAQDLGLDPDDVSQKLISLGHKRLLPKDALAAFALIESRAHALIDANTFPFLNGLGHFLPNRKLADVTGKLDKLEAEFRTARAEFTRQYAKLRAEAISEWHDAARKLVRDPDRVVATINAAFPTPDRLTRHFGFAVNLFQIRLPEKLEADLTTAADQQAIMAARAQAATDARTKIREGVEGFVQEAVASLREQTATLCDEMLASMRDGKTGVHQKTLNRLVDFIDRFKNLNFAGDSELEERLDAVRKEFLGRTAEQYRDSASARRRLDAGIRSLADEARKLAQSDATEIVERFGQMGVRKFTLAA
jgi:ElaB/YqjD/DUF883 family membrane-anchored ribosome-binding protein